MTNLKPDSTRLNKEKVVSIQNPPAFFSNFSKPLNFSNFSKPLNENCRADGFSIVELIIVLAIIAIASGISLFYLSAHQRLFKPDEQTLQIGDLMQEARQRSLTQRETIRVEVDLTDNIARLVDENTTSTKKDVKIREIQLLPTTQVSVETAPPDISTKPNEVMVLPAAEFKTSTSSTSLNHSKVFTLRFKNDGTVIDADGKPDGATLYIWSPKKNQTNQSEIALAITIEPSGLIRHWQYNRSSTATNKWQS